MTRLGLGHLEKMRNVRRAVAGVRSTLLHVERPNLQCSPRSIDSELLAKSRHDFEGFSTDRVDLLVQGNRGGLETIVEGHAWRQA